MTKSITESLHASSLDPVPADESDLTEDQRRIADLLQAVTLREGQVASLQNELTGHTLCCAELECRAESAEADNVRLGADLGQALTKLLTEQGKTARLEKERNEAQDAEHVALRRVEALEKALRAVTVSGPDAIGLYWVTIQIDGKRAALPTDVRAYEGGLVVPAWKKLRDAALSSPGSAPAEGYSVGGPCPRCGSDDTVVKGDSATQTCLRCKNGSYAPERAPTHRCKVCGALWRLWKRGEVPHLDAEMWNMVSPTCGPCCDNVEMTVGMRGQIEALPAPPERAAPEGKCSVCGSQRLWKNGRWDACSFVGNGGAYYNGCPEPLRDFDRERAAERAAPAEPPPVSAPPGAWPGVRLLADLVIALSPTVIIGGVPHIPYASLLDAVRALAEKERSTPVSPPEPAALPRQGARALTFKELTDYLDRTVKGRQAAEENAEEDVTQTAWRMGFKAAVGEVDFAFREISPAFPAPTAGAEEPPREPGEPALKPGQYHPDPAIDAEVRAQVAVDDAIDRKLGLATSEFGQRKCSACGYANHDLRKMCRNCDAVLPELPPAPPPVQAPAEEKPADG